jgi:hypothetical protein
MRFGQFNLTSGELTQPQPSSSLRHGQEIRREFLDEEIARKLA